MRWILVLSTLCSCMVLKKFPDNPIEEAVEDWIEEETGIKVDFSGDTKEISCVLRVEMPF